MTKQAIELNTICPQYTEDISKSKGLASQNVDGTACFEAGFRRKMT